MSGRCPFCAGTDLAHTMKGQGICLDCERTWTPGGRKKRPAPLVMNPSDAKIAAMIRDMGNRG